MDLDGFQRGIGETYLGRDAERGVPATVAWLASLANQLDLSLAEALARYADGCPRCGARPCGC